MENVPSCPPKPRRGQARKLAAAALASMPLTERERAQLLGCSTRQARRIQKQVLAEIGTVAERLETFRRLLAAQLPLTRRVALLKRLAEQWEHLPTALKALEQANRIDGLLQPELEQLQEERPMFVFASAVQMNIGSELPRDPSSGPEQPPVTLGSE